MKNYGFLLLIVVASISLNACYYFQLTTVPISTQKYFYSDNNKWQRTSDSASRRNNSDLLILLPGIAGHPDEKIMNELLHDLHVATSKIDVIAVDAHFNYYRKRSFLERLKIDVVEPAFEQGYERIHLMGVSLGGYGALLYLREYSEDVASATLLAPYLGENEEYLQFTSAEFASSKNTNLEAQADFAEGNLWPWLSKLPQETKKKIFLGYGLQDDFSVLNSNLAAFLNGEHVFTTEGEHRWSTWLPLWQQLTAKNDLW